MKTLMLAGLLALTALTANAEAGSGPAKPRIEPYVPTIELRSELRQPEFELAQRRNSRGAVISLPVVAAVRG